MQNGAKFLGYVRVNENFDCFKLSNASIKID